MKESHARANPASGAAKPTRPPSFDTMASVDTLTKAHIEQGHASAIVGVVRDSQRELATEASLIATKVALQSEMDALKQGLCAEMVKLRADVKGDMTALRSEMAEQRADINRQFAQLYRQLLIVGGTGVTVIVGLLGTMIALARGGGF